MSFNKSKAMKNAERYLTQGKIQAAINEYKQIVENDTKDINSRNMLGDLYIKADDKQAAVNCYQEVAEHYGSQGFAKKAIAIYNKIYRIDPSSFEISAKLADLYQTRGSYVEARKHYQEIADRYEEKGHKIEALEIWEKIAAIAPQDTEIYLKIADAYWQNDRRDDAAKAFVQAGNRLADLDKHESAVTAFSRSLEVNSDDLSALKGFVKSQTALGFPEEGAEALEQIIAEHEYDKEINYLLMDCYFEMGKPEKAEQVIIKLIEREPANYPKLLELVNVYLENDDLDASVRILSMTSEHLLVGGESEELLELLNEVLARNPEHIAALRLLARYHGWQRDELELQQTLERLADSAYLNGEIEDERYALSQYMLLVPHDTKRSDRLKEINSEYGFQEGVEEQLLNPNTAEIPTFESFATLNDENHTNESSGFEMIDEKDVVSEEEVYAEEVVVDESQIVNVEPEAEQNETSTNQQDVSQNEHTDNPSNEIVDTELSPSDEVRIESEIDSVKFYIDQGYTGLAEKSLAELVQEFGRRKEIVELLEQVSGDTQTVEPENTQTEQEVVATEVVEEETFDESVAGEEIYQQSEQEDVQADIEESLETESDSQEEPIEEEEIQLQENPIEEIVEEVEEEKGFTNSFDDFKDELGLDDVAPQEQDDYEEHYQHAVVYQEMGMLEEAIREFQDAVNCIEANDGTHRFLNCCTLIGHCFMQKGMPNLALTWFERSFETTDLNHQEKLGVYYEIANALEANDEREKAIDQFEKIYSLDVDYRDVSERLEKLRENVLTTA